jgi:AcrR family transcriptional regulator
MTESQAKPAPPMVELDTKTQPSQDRSRATFDVIIRVAGEILAERGVDGFSINILVQRAGLSPPAVYRYFPNKYAIMKELGERIMAAQDKVALEHLDRRWGAPLSETALIEATFGLLKQLVRVTADFPGSIAVLRAMRALPVLREVRLASARMVADRHCEALAVIYPHADRDRIASVAWLLSELGNSVTELLVESDDDQRDRLTRDCAIMFARLQTSLA